MIYGLIVTVLSTAALTCITTEAVSAQEAAHILARPSIQSVWPDGNLRWSSADSVAMRYFSQDTHNFVAPVIQSVPSPDGRYFYLISFRGDLARDCADMRLDIYDAGVVQRWVLSAAEVNRPMPVRSVSICGRDTDQDPITAVQWVSPDAVGYVGVDPKGKYQIYRLAVGTGKIEQLSSGPDFKFAPKIFEDTAVYRVNVPFDPGEPKGPMVVAPRNSAGKIVFPLRAPVGHQPFRLAWMLASRGHPTREVLLGNPESITIGAFASPRGEQIILKPDLLNTPLAEMKAVLRPWILVDAKTGRANPIALEPGSSSGRLVDKDLSQEFWSSAFWSSDGSRVVLGGVGIDEDGLPGKNKSGPTPFVASYALDTGRWQVLEARTGPAGKISGISWVITGEELLITHESSGKPATGTLYKLVDGSWQGSVVPPDFVARTHSAVRTPAAEIRLRGDANHPPMLIARVGSREKRFSDPDPAIAGRWYAPVEPFSWQMPDGTTMTGGLSLPQQLERGSRLPLVIQLGRYFADRFLPESYGSTGYAPQSLVADGFAVLQIDITQLPGFGTAKLEVSYVQALDAAVAKLTDQGLIDPARVASVGHSHAGFSTMYAVTHQGRVHLRAAIALDSDIQYLLSAMESGATGYGASAFERSIGGNFWRDRAIWAENDSLFNINKGETPMLFMDFGEFGRNAGEIHASSLMNIGAWQLNNRPIEFLSFPNAAHLLSRPSQRKAAMDAVVDWLRFWLQDREDPDAAKREQYERWRPLRAKWEAQQLWERGGEPAGSNPDLGVINAWGYHALYDTGDVTTALGFFRANTVLFPQVADVWDSLAEGCLQAGDKTCALENYSRALAMNPSLPSATVVARLKADPDSIRRLQAQMRDAYRAASPTK